MKPNYNLFVPERDQYIYILIIDKHNIILHNVNT